MEDEELVKRARKGNAAAFQQLAERYYPAVERFAYQLGNRQEDVKDVAQEVFLRVYRFLDQFSQAKFSTWLYKITLNVTRDMARKRNSSLKKIWKLQQDYKEEYEEVEGSLLQDEKSRELHACIQKLDEKYKVPIILFYFHEKKYEEIADILSLTLSTVKTRILRGKALLKKSLEEKKRKEGDFNER
ncbi:sigma-70 family RNA polymerase sigma factor [Metabacillus sp. GX 13764]|uniref:RNA polymerase sigma factor n=1 Tax=Metabacillus kandeliae TaxID=2900151 RepID=UPI001E61AF16|nr:sigma-70 family RNA polymerase sigma factor [Metabacillus kandeliae]MCD7035753.1 sigma-70 family RNA polymerase sigma factor [Metabacillus kandeliae]